MPAETRTVRAQAAGGEEPRGGAPELRAELPLIENHPYFQTVTSRATSTWSWQRAGRRGSRRLQGAQPLGQAGPVILAAGTPQILLPWDNAATFVANLRAQGDAQLATWMAWQAPGSMKPADAARRVGMSEKDLREINRIPNGVLIKAGSTLLVVRRRRYAMT
jgi:membrane-bound lytic murein transglycosylase D